MRAALHHGLDLEANGEAGDESGVRLAEFAAGSAPRSPGREVVPDDGDLIAYRLRHWARTARAAI